MALIIKYLKSRFKLLKKTKNPIIKLIYSIVRSIWLFLSFLIKPNLRNSYLGKLRYKEQYFQQSTRTFLNRYPVLFNLCQQYFKQNYSSNQPKKILSFGCSTGEEVFTLNDFFPNTQIFGIDINPWCITECKRKYATKSNFIFLNSPSEKFKLGDDFDAIFCLAVLQHTKNRTQSNDQKATAFTFQQFEAILTNLDKRLKPNGLLVIDQTDFRFLETEISKTYKVYQVKDNNMTIAKRRTFDKNNKLVKQEYSGYRIFIKN
jgi:chemotaxis methyl-accepting protein methylase